MVTTGQLADSQSDSKPDEYTAGPTNTSITVSSPSNSSVQMNELTRPAGIGESSVSEEEIFETHTEALEKTTYVAKYNKTLSGETITGKSLNPRLFTKVVRQGPNETLVRTDHGSKEVSEWSNGSVAYKRGYGGDGLRIFKPRRPPVESELTFYSRVKALITTADYEVVGVASLHGKPVFVLESQELIAPGVLEDRIAVGDVRTFNATVYISKSGIIHQIRYQIEEDGGDAVYTEKGVMEVTGVNATEVDSPDWLASAPEDAVLLDPTVKSTALAMKMENGEPVPSDSKIIVQRTNGEKYTATLKQQVSEGDTLYLARSQDGKLVVSVNKKPSGNTQTFRRAFVTVKKDGLVYEIAPGIGPSLR